MCAMERLKAKNTIGRYEILRFDRREQSKGVSKNNSISDFDRFHVEKNLRFAIDTPAKLSKLYVDTNRNMLLRDI